MPTLSEDCALLKVLASLAWADGTVTEAEVQFLHGLAVEFRLSPPETAALDELLREPVGIDVFEQVVREFHAQADGTKARELVERAERLVAADGHLHADEQRYLGLIRRWLREAPQAGAPARSGFVTDQANGSPGDAQTGGGIGSLFGGIRNALGGGASAKPAGEAARGLFDRVRQVFASGDGTKPPRISELRATYATLFGALLYRVIYADAVVQAEEARHLHEELEEHFGFSPDEVDVVLGAIRQRVAHDLDRQRLCAEFNRLTTMEERCRLVQALFTLAAKDGRITSDEEREIRLISNYLWVEVQEYSRIRREVLAD